MDRSIVFRGLGMQSNEWRKGLLMTNHLGSYIVTEENPHECTQYGYLEIDEYERVLPETIGQYYGSNVSAEAAFDSGPSSERRSLFEGDIVRKWVHVYTNHYDNYALSETEVHFEGWIYGEVAYSPSMGFHIKKRYSEDYHDGNVEKVSGITTIIQNRTEVVGTVHTHDILELIKHAN